MEQLLSFTIKTFPKNWVGWRSFALFLWARTDSVSNKLRNFLLIYMQSNKIPKVIFNE